MSLPEALTGALNEPIRMTVGDLLALFGERNRDFEIVGRVETTLTESGLCCDPPLLHGELEYTVLVRAPGNQAPGDSASTEAPDNDPLAMSVRIRDLPTARLDGGPLSVCPDDDLAHARTLMSLHKYSQLPVLAGPYLLKGVVSWKSIAMAHTRGVEVTLAEATEEAPEVRIDADLLATIPGIYENDYVFVRDTDQKISGIVTAADLTQEFGKLSGPYLRLGEIERRLRRCVDRMCSTVEDLRDASGNKKAHTAHDLSVHQIGQVFEKPDRWAILGWGVSQDVFLTEQSAVRRIRNQVAHFRPNPLTEEEVDRVYAFAGWLKELVP